MAAGGSAVGTALLRRAAAAFPEAKRALPRAAHDRRRRPADRPGDAAERRLEVHGYVHELHRQLAACDVAISHGGLSTTMELTAAGRPFLYFPLRGHFEQNRHVAHRLDRHGAGRRMRLGGRPAARRRARAGARPRAALPPRRAGRRRAPAEIIAELL